MDPENVNANLNKGCAFINFNMQEEALELETPNFKGQYYNGIIARKLLIVLKNP